MPNENKKIDIPGFVPTECSPSFFILDAQGKRIFPKNKTYDKLESMWDAYKDLSTLPEDELKLAYDRYVTTESAKTTTPNTDQAKPLDDIHKPRTWTSSKNGKEITGQAISYDGATVTLRINNNDVKSSKTNFIKEDQDWLDRHQEAIQQANPHKEETKSEPPTKETANNSVAKAMEQANINGKATIKQQAKYFIIFSSLHDYAGDTGYQLQAATMDAITKDPHIQFIIEGSSIPSKETYQKAKEKNLYNIPIIPYFYDWGDYLQTIKPNSKLKIPWNATIEKDYKERWNSALTEGKVQGPLPMPDKGKRIDIPGFSSMRGRSPAFYIIDAQGQHIFPKNRGSASVEDIWDAYKVLTTLSEEELTQSYNKYMNTSISKKDLGWLELHQKTIKQEKLNNSNSSSNNTNKNLVDYPVAHAVQQANVNRKADTKTKLKAKYFIFSFGIWPKDNSDLKRYQLLKAAMEAEEKDPDIQFVFITGYFPLLNFYKENSNNRPIVLDLSSCGRYYIDAIKPSSKLTLPWNENIEAAYKKRWDEKLAEGTAKGAFPMPDENIKIDIPGFVLTNDESGFFILDAQGKRVFPQDKNHARFDDIWDAYKNISTIPEEVLKLSYDKYVTKETETAAKKDTEATSPSPAEAKLLEDVSKERAWTSSKNGKQITGKVIAYDGSTVTLRINNKNVQSPKTNFSNEDQDWLNQHQEAIQQAKINKQKTNGDSPNKELNENPVANAIKQANINRKANSKIKSQAKYFIFCWGTAMILTQKRFQLQAATMDCTKKDPHIQFILVSDYFSEGKTNPSNLRDFPIILDLASYSTSGDNDYRNAIKAGPQVKLPWNNIIEERQKRLWESNRKDGKVRGNFPLPDENRRINIPGYSPAVFTPSFFIVDSQGKRIVPKNGEGSSSLEGIWKAYTGITTLPEEDLQSSYRRYVEAQFRNDD